MERKPRGFWTKDNVFAEAKKYETKSDFQTGCPSAHAIAYREGWINEMNWFEDGRVKLLTNKIDCVYKYYFKETNSIYIGRTIHKVDTICRHRTKEEDTVYKYAKNNGFEVPEMEIIEDNLTIEEGLDREDYWKNYYKNKGYNVLNIGKTGIGSGSIGAINSGKWNKKTIFAEAKKYKTKYEFQSGCGSAYVAARRKGLLKEMNWFEEGRKPNFFWTKEMVFSEAKKYKTKREFKKGCSSAYTFACKNNWIDEMVWLISSQRPNGFWTKENVFAEAKKYQTRKKFSDGCHTAYDIARRNGWLEEMSWFTSLLKPYGYWNIKQNVFEAAKKFKTKSEFKTSYNKAYQVARVNGWLNEMDWFKEVQKPRGFWTKENVFAEAKKYKTRNEFRKYSNGAYDVARHNGWLDELFVRYAA